MLRYISRMTQNGMIQNNEICFKIGATLIDEKTKESHLK